MGIKKNIIVYVFNQNLQGIDVFGGFYILWEIGHLFFAQSGEKVLLNRGRKLHN